MKQSKGSKQLKSLSLSRLDGVREVALGHKATADRPPRNYSKSDYVRTHDEHADVRARNKRWGLG
jgi:hypothetical protein